MSQYLRANLTVLVCCMLAAACGQSGAPEAQTVAAPADVAEPVVKDIGLAELPSGRYELEKTHGYITFTYSHMGFSNPHVGFEEFDVSLELDTQSSELTALAVTINADSIKSRVDDFDAHLREEELFDTSSYPTIGFTGEQMEINGAEFTVTGPLTIKDVSRQVTLSGQINKAGNHPMRNVPTIGISASAKVARSDWGLSLGVPAVSDEVTIYIEAELIAGE